MAYSASALSFLLGDIKKPVVFTGSQLPIGKLRTDGKENLITAIEIAAARDVNSNARVPEVSVFFDDYLLRGNRTSKVSADQFNAFASHNYPPLAYAGIEIKYQDKYIGYQLTSTNIQRFSKLNPNVIVLKLFPGITPSILESVLSIPSLRGNKWNILFYQGFWCDDQNCERKGTQCDGGCLCYPEVGIFGGYPLFPRGSPLGVGCR